MNPVDKYYKQIERIEKKIEEIQEACSHPKVCLEKKNNGSTGNYDPTNDGYWTDFHCTLCDKRWTEEGTK